MPGHDRGPAAGPPARVAVFVAGGPLALAALEALRTQHEIVVLVRAARRRSFRATLRDVARRVGLRPPDPIARWSTRFGIPMVTVARGDATGAAARVAALRPMIGCIATWPRKVPAPLLAAAGRECLNLHTSLLPRHRGASPLFWTYHAGDADAGVSVHLATDRLDAGPILERAALPLERGAPILGVHQRCADMGGPLLARAVSRLSCGTEVRTPQDDAQATPAPSPVPGQRYADLPRWSVAHTWHYLHGLVGYHQEPLCDAAGRVVRYAGVEGYEERTPREAPGSIVAVPGGWDAWARDGVVRLSASASVRSRG